MAIAGMRKLGQGHTSHTGSQAFSLPLASPNFSAIFVLCLSPAPPPTFPDLSQGAATQNASDLHVPNFTHSFRFGSRSPLLQEAFSGSCAPPPLDPRFLYHCSLNVGRYRLARSLSLVSQASPSGKTSPRAGTVSCSSSYPLQYLGGLGDGWN